MKQQSERIYGKAAGSRGDASERGGIFGLSARGERRLRLLFAVLFNVGMLLLLYRLFDPVFEGNDDITAAQFVNGSCGSYDPHMVYQNYLMGLVLSNLYRAFPAVPWYSWFQFGAICVSFTAITYVLCSRVRRGAGLGLMLLVQSFAAYEFYINLQYTKTAGLLAAAGMLLLWHGLAGEERGGPEPCVERDARNGGKRPSGWPVEAAFCGGRILMGSVAAGLLLAAWSILYRYAQFAACAVLTAPIPLLLLLDCAGAPSGRREGSKRNMTEQSVRREGGSERAEAPSGRREDSKRNMTERSVRREGGSERAEAPSGRQEGSKGNTGKQSIRQKNGKKSAGAPEMFLRCLGAMAVLGALFAALVFFDRSMYERDPAWKNYVEYNNARSELMDYGMPKYEDNQELYTELGISRTAYDLFDTWNSGDTAVFSTEVMKKLAAARTKKKPGLSTLKAFAKEVPKGFLKNRIFRCFLVALALWLLFGRHDPRAVFALLAEAALFGALYYYLFLKGRYLYNRVDTGLWMSAILVLLWTWKRRQKSLPANAFRAVLILAVMAVCVYVQIPGWKGKLSSHNVEKRQKRQEMRLKMAEISKDGGRLYVSKLGILSASRCCAPFEPIPKDLLSNVAVLGGWKVESVPYNAILQKYGFHDNPYEAISGTVEGAAEVCLLDEEVDTTIAYLKEYYNPDAEAVEAGEWNQKTIWRVVSRP